MAGLQDVNSMRTFTDKRATEFSVCNVVAIGSKGTNERITRFIFNYRAGAKCEKCSDGFYPDSRRDKLGRQSCIPCNCNEAGSNNDQCSDSGT